MEASHATRFIAAFNAIEEEFRDRLGPRHSQGFVHALKLLRPDHADLRLYYDELQEFARLRNIMVHTMRKDHFRIVPDEDMVQEIEAIRDALLKPPTVADVMSLHPYHARPTARVRDVVHEFRERNFMRCPVIDHKGICGLITAKSITNWISEMLLDPSNPGSLESLDHVMDHEVQEVLPYCSAEEYGIVPRGYSLVDAVHVFRRSVKKGKYLQCLLVTTDGGVRSPLVGIIAPSDLPRLVNDEIDFFE